MEQQGPRWRVYVTEWVTAWASTSPGEAGLEEARAHYAETWAGRLRDEDWDIKCLEPPGSAFILIRVPNLRSEWKDYAEAVAQGGALANAQIVQAGSEGERVLLDYGKRKLPADA